MTQNFRAVIFDFGNVLCFPPADSQFAQAAALLGLPLATFLDAFWQDRIAYDRGEDARTYWSRIAALGSRHLTDELLHKLIALEIQFWSNFDQRVLAWARDLRQAGFKTGILSNLPRTIGQNLRATPGFLEHFDHITFSYELSIVKPQPQIYHHAVAGLALAPHEALFLDDRLENVEGARAIGLIAHQFTTWERFVADGLAAFHMPAPTSA